MEDWEMKEVEDKEEFEAEEEKGEKREALQALLNHGEDELEVLRYKGDMRMKLGLLDQEVRSGE